jgi:hypothetical protein
MMEETNSNLADLWAVAGARPNAEPVGGQDVWPDDCPGCGWKLTGKFSRCPRCGERIVLTRCAYCQGPVPLDVAACPHCTAPVPA